MQRIRGLESLRNLSQKYIREGIRRGEMQQIEIRDVAILFLCCLLQYLPRIRHCTPSVRGNLDKIAHNQDTEYCVVVTALPVASDPFQYALTLPFAVCHDVDDQTLEKMFRRMVRRWIANQVLR